VEDCFIEELRIPPKQYLGSLNQDLKHRQTAAYSRGFLGGRALVTEARKGIFDFDNAGYTSRTHDVAVPRTWLGGD
jgi:hypothetical protein